MTSVDGDNYSLPPKCKWMHYPVLIQPEKTTIVYAYDSSREIEDFDNVPLGIPLEFESEIFKGKVLIRIRHAPSMDPSKHDAYFHGRKRLLQTVIQGQFKTNIKMSDLLVGSIFQKPLKCAPPIFITKILQRMISRIAPGVTLDLAGKEPKVLALYGGTAQTISIDLPEPRGKDQGGPPDISAVDIPENVTAVFGDKKFRSIADRKKFLSKPKNACKYNYDPKYVYTFQTYDDSMDLGSYSMNVPLYGKFPLSSIFGPFNPMNLSAVVENQNKTLFSFHVWHESVASDSVKELSPVNQKDENPISVHTVVVRICI